MSTAAMEATTSEQRERMSASAASIVEQVCAQMRRLFGAAAQSVILYGSYARGDFDEESDIDIAVLVRMNRRELKAYDKDVVRLMSSICMERGVVANIVVLPADEFEQRKDSLPFYRTVATEGVRHAA